MILEADNLLQAMGYLSEQFQKYGLVGKEKLSESVFYPYFSTLGPWLLDHLGKIIPFFKDIFSQLQQYFEGVPKNYSN